MSSAGDRDANANGPGWTHSSTGSSPTLGGTTSKRHSFSTIFVEAETVFGTTRNVNNIGQPQRDSSLRYRQSLLHRTIKLLIQISIRSTLPDCEFRVPQEQTDIPLRRSRTSLRTFPGGLCY
ncbi:hypothetical protein VTL71DRAFT_8580 [Oculimacula yallundae]|uniref:Uncharacterized protein n=1 Tax=Oculimacula yallundae TaxID=86028 RepID=A0ABR4CY63_9HELO